MLVIKSIVLIYFHTVFISLYGSQWGPTTVWFKIYFVENKKETQTGLERPKDE